MERMEARVRLDKVSDSLDYVGSYEERQRKPGVGGIRKCYSYVNCLLF